MRFLHTGDWHIGKPLRGRGRMDEYARALEEVAAIAVQARVDAVLIAGDVFDSTAPPVEAERLVYDFLARLLPERIACVVVAGNHDHPRKLAALALLLEGLRIYVRSEVRPAAEGGVVRVASRDGGCEAHVAVLPFVPERKVVDACLVMGPEHQWYAEYAHRIAQILRFLTDGFTPKTVNLVLGHLLISGARVGTGERPLHLGEIYGITPEQIPSGVQYVGLGHLHRPQQVLAPSPTAYAGSLIELDFGEREQEKKVVVVEAQPGAQPAHMEWVALSAGRRLRDVEGSLAELRAMAAGAGSDFLRVRVRTEGPVPGLAEQVREALPNAVDIQLVYPRGDAPQPAPGPRLKQLDPLELFEEFYRRKNGVAPAAELTALFRTAYEEASHR